MFFRNIYILCSVLITVSLFAQEKSVIHRGDIEFKQYRSLPRLPLYLANGRFGSCYGQLGLHNNPTAVPNSGKFGKTQFMHIQHAFRGKFGMDYMIPLARIYWKNEPAKVDEYRQYQDMLEATLTTEFRNGDNEVSVVSWFDAVNRNMAGFTIDKKGEASSVILEPFRELAVHYNQNVTQTCVQELNGQVYKATLTCGNVSTTLYLQTNAVMTLLKNGVELQLAGGENYILVTVNSAPDVTAETSLKRTVEWWQNTWTNTAWINIEDADVQKMWVRSIFQILATYNDDGIGLAPANGFTGNAWPFSFPQDLSYIHPVLLSTGHLNVAKSWVEYFARNIGGMKKNTFQIMHTPGIMCPWVFPFGSFDGFQADSVPNHFYYEIHNSGYLCRMAHETAEAVNDKLWSMKFAIPLIKETTLFYRSICKKGIDGYWHITVQPAMGQDEMGPENQSDYLCALYSALYCFKISIEHGLDADGSLKKILQDGLAFPLLKNDMGFYNSYKSGKNFEPGMQKHPVQLNALTFLPANESITAEDSLAYANRYKITRDAYKPWFYGWTLCDFLLADSRMQKPVEWMKDWERLSLAYVTDPDYIQLFETSAAFGSSYYITNNGLFAQSVLNNIVSDWRRTTLIAPCIPWEGETHYGNIHLESGKIISGTIEKNGDNVQSKFQLK